MFKDTRFSFLLLLCSLFGYVSSMRMVNCSQLDHQMSFILPFKNSLSTYLSSLFCTTNLNYILFKTYLLDTSKFLRRYYVIFSLVSLPVPGYMQFLVTSWCHPTVNKQKADFQFQDPISYT